MTITKKHFINIAKIIDEHGSFEFGKKEIFVNAFCNYFKSENKNFDSIKFYNACFSSRNKKDKDINSKIIKVLKSKVKTYEQDINKRNTNIEDLICFDKID